jgi:uncharacterized protein (TIGR02611 family)
MDQALTPTDAELAARDVPPMWKRVGLHGPAILFRWITGNAKRIAVFVVGMLVLLAGVAMIALPGPGLLVVIAGLAILATEFAWAERALDTAKARAAQVGSMVRRTVRRPKG